MIINKNKGRPVNPTNHVKRGVRQGLFLYELYSYINLINLSIRGVIYEQKGI